jgi:hypothetical protein
MNHMISAPKRGDQIALIATDPWELVSEVGEAPLAGKVVDIDQTTCTAIIELDKPLSYAGKEASFFLATPRRLNAGFGDDDQKQAFCGLTSMSLDQVSAGMPAYPGDLRGEIMMLGDLSW